MWTECNSLLITIEELELSLIDKADLEIKIKQLLGSVCDDKCLDKCLCAYCVNRRHLFIESSQTWFSCTTSDHSSVNHCPPYSLTGTCFLEMLPLKKNRLLSFFLVNSLQHFKSERTDTEGLNIHFFLV